MAANEAVLRAGRTRAAGHSIASRPWEIEVSYDLVAFDPSIAPRDPEAFKAWFMAEKATYDGWPALSPALARFFDAMRAHYRSLNGPDVVGDDEDFDLVADYSFSPAVIVACFSWKKAEEVYPLFRKLAVETDVGFYDLSANDGEIHFPGTDLLPESGGAWRRIAAWFRGERDKP
jgi:hypothetical protein